MVLALAVHSTSATATVPLNILILQDLIKRKALPANLKCRLVIPSAGVQNVSLWDCSSVADLQAWLDENLHQDCSSTVAQVQEEFCHGVSLELSKQRTSDKVSEGSRQTFDRVNSTVVDASNAIMQKFDQWDQKTGIITSAKEGTSKVVSKINAGTTKLVEHEKVAVAVERVQSGVNIGFERAKQGFTWLSGKVMGSAATSQPEGYHSSTFGAEGPDLHPLHTGMGGGMPTSTQAQYNGMYYPPAEGVPAQGVAVGYPQGPPPAYDASYGQEAVVQPHMPGQSSPATAGVGSEAAWGTASTEEPAFTLGDDPMEQSPTAHAAASAAASHASLHPPVPAPAETVAPSPPAAETAAPSPPAPAAAPPGAAQ